MVQVTKFAYERAWLREVPPVITFFGFHAHGAALDKEMEIFDYLKRAHQNAPDEWGDLPSVKACTKTYAAFILDWYKVRNGGDWK
ncbi:hypothetical protein ACI7RC_12275 [Brevibacillus sp. B_LB10_24]|uniref:hypothetical protein n=1 Tax=Brevibacillus sp. B_LB10_24 TaxID=3380645 RepID=UPI0038B9DCB1